jgi:vancomycin permeability regulator SanA
VRRLRIVLLAALAPLLLVVAANGLPRLRLREALARVKVVADAFTGADPRFLGPQLPIGGDGRETWGPAGPAA